jgi:hypothetical protein
LEDAVKTTHHTHRSISPSHPPRHQITPQKTKKQSQIHRSLYPSPEEDTTVSSFSSEPSSPSRQQTEPHTPQSPESSKDSTIESDISTPQDSNLIKSATSSGQGTLRRRHSIHGPAHDIDFAERGRPRRRQRRQYRVASFSNSPLASPLPRRYSYSDLTIAAMNPLTWLSHGT